MMTLSEARQPNVKHNFWWVTGAGGFNGQNKGH